MSKVHLKTRKIHLKKMKKVSKKNLLVGTLVVGFLAVLYLLNILNQRISPILLETAELEINKMSTIVVNKAIAQVLEDKINTDELFSTITSQNGEIQTIDFNPIIVNQVLNVATTVVQNNLKLLEEGNLDNIGIYDMDLPEDRIEKLKKGIIT